MVPTEPVEVDWNHPLSAGLVACYVPGGYAGLADLTGIGPTLIPGNAGATLAGPEGPGYACLQAQASAYSAQFPAAWQLTEGGTLFWRGVFLGQVSSSEYNVVWGNVSTPNVQYPPNCYAIIASFDQTIQFRFLSGDTAEVTVVPLDVANNMQGLPVTIAVSFNIGPSASITIYVWSVRTVSPPVEVANVFGSNTWTGGVAPDYSQSPQPCLGSDLYSSIDGYSNTISTSAYLYNRPLGAAEITRLNYDPFVMLRPIKRVLRNSSPPAIGPFRRWNRTYLIR